MLINPKHETRFLRRLIFATIICGSLLVGSSGCVSARLGQLATQQSVTITDVYEQQVLNNLASFVVNPHSNPHFAVADQSTSGVKNSVDTGFADGALTLNFWAFVHAGGTRDTEGNFTYIPVKNAERLRLMQCVYQQAVGVPGDPCGECRDLLVAWNGGDQAIDPYTGIWSGWVCSSRSRHDIPKCCCRKYGEFCGVYVWADPDHTEQFSKLVMKIFEFATKDFPEGPPLKEVVFYLDENGKPTKYGQHATEFRAKVAEDADVAQIENKLKISAEIRDSQSLLQRLNDKNDTLSQIEALLHPSTVLNRAVQTDQDEQLSNLRKSAQSILENTPFNDLKSDPKKTKEIIDLENSIKPNIKEKIKMNIEQDINTKKAELMYLDKQITPKTSRIDFGPPTHYSSPNGGLLKLQQQLNTIPNNRR